MRWCVGLIVRLLWMAGCQPHIEAPPPPAPPPEDLSTWTVPALVQPPAPAPQAPAPREEKPTAAEKVYPYAPGMPYTVQVPVGWPLDIVLEPGEKVYNIVGGDRAPEASAPVPVKSASGDQTERLQAAIAQAAAAPPPPAPEPSAGARRWEVKEGLDGGGETVRSHIFVAASAPGLTTGLI